MLIYCLSLDLNDMYSNKKKKSKIHPLKSIFLQKATPPKLIILPSFLCIVMNNIHYKNKKVEKGCLLLFFVWKVKKKVSVPGFGPVPGFVPAL